MSFIRVVPQEEATGDLKAVYEEMIEQWKGRLPPVLQILSLHPQALKRLKDFNLAATFGASTLGRRGEELIATAVSAWNGCSY